MFVSDQYTFGEGSIGSAALAIGNAKAGLDFVPAVALGIMCNGLVCLAVWLTFSARTTTDRILAIVPPIAAFVAAGPEHSVANMYFIPEAIAIRALAPDRFWATIGNVIGGAVMVGIVYWFVYLRDSSDRR